MKPTDVFTPGTFPEHTYVAVVDQTGKRVEARLKEYLSIPGMLVSITGPSKSGKTVLIEKVVGKDNLIPISGASIKSVADLWGAVFDWMETPTSKVKATETARKSTIGGEATAEANFVVAKGGGKVLASMGDEKKQLSSEISNPRTLENIYSEIGNSDFVILIDDFHYMARDIQSEIAQQLKECIRNRVKVIYAAVPYHFDDIIRANPDFLGRVYSIDMSYWNAEQLKEIAEKGMPVLGLNVTDSLLTELSKEAAGSPQLMQSICLSLCTTLRQEHRGNLGTIIQHSDINVEQLLRDVSVTASYEAFVTNLEDGAKTRGRARKTYTLKTAVNGDVYYIFIRSLAVAPTQLQFRYKDILNRIVALCSADSPSGSSVTSAISQLVEIAIEQKKDNVFEWVVDDEIFLIKDPYFIFFLRWSGRYN